MKFFRKIIYLDEYKQGNRGGNIGFIKLSQKQGRVKAEISLAEDRTLAGEKIYLLDKDNNAVNKVFFGTITESGSDINMTISTGDTKLLKGQLAGILIGGDGYLVCAGTDDETIQVTDYVKTDKKTEKAHLTMEEEVRQCILYDELTEKPTKSLQQKPAVQPKREREKLNEDIITEKARGQAPGEEQEQEEEEIIEFEMEEEHDAAYMFRKLCDTRPNMYPFEDDEMEMCVQISPADFSDFPQKYWHMGSNTFLLQGYYNYRHLILARKGDSVYVGIPGQYHRRDKYLAEMFGFGRFKCIQKKEQRLGDFGYWLMEVEVPVSASGYREMEYVSIQ